MISREQLQSFVLQFITHENERYDYYTSALKALEGGCRWIQLRMKDSSITEIEQVALQLKPICKEYGATFIIDDHVEICQKVNADGVHLGKNDMNPVEARKLLGNKYIIGGTCNSYSDILRIEKSVDYVGCGPFRFTQTKKNLAPVLGLPGYQDIVWKCRMNGINLPIVAIGGITVDDVESIFDAGPNGVAVSGTILNAENPVETTAEILSKISVVKI